ncbi:hypothetical protein DI392_17950 [Vibrio albus]|uniref:DUF4407 domain-containing protein n=1 Tax=Vibrio albus TaxID=2200953 RepID=A0A2U3B5C8_9VIBR|nr:DUF4407 domain-containing protein [Vibrio albus]PWI31915.1 hypothetical protein DI392_17950 [Vibrio albus]
MQNFLLRLSATDTEALSGLPKSAYYTRLTLGWAIFIHICISLTVWVEAMYTWFGIYATPAAVFITGLLASIDRLIVATPIAIPDDPHIDYRTKGQRRSTVYKRLCLSIFFSSLTGLTFALNFSEDAINDELNRINNNANKVLIREREGEHQALLEESIKLRDKAHSELARLEAEGKRLNLEIEKSTNAAAEERKRAAREAQTGCYTKCNNAIRNVKIEEKKIADLQNMLPDTRRVSNLQQNITTLNNRILQLKTPMTIDQLQAEGFTKADIGRSLTSRMKGFVSLLMRDQFTWVLVAFFIAGMIVLELTVLIAHTIASGTEGERLYSHSLLLQNRFYQCSIWDTYESKIAQFSL